MPITKPRGLDSRSPMRSMLIAALFCLGPVFTAYAELGDLVAEFGFAAEKFALNPVRSELYASLPASNSVAVIDIDNLQLLAAPFVGSSPKGVAVSADGLKLYVANSGSSALAVLDTTAHIVSTSIALPANPSDVVAGNGYLFVTPATSSTGIMQVDATAGSYVGDFAAGVLVYGNGMLAMSPDRNTLYFGNRGLSPGTLAKYDVSGAAPTLLYKNPHGTLGSNGQDLALSHDGTFVSYAVGGGNGPGYTVYKLDSASLSSLGEFNTGAYPREIAFGHDDSYAYTVNQSGEIKVFDTSTLLLVTTITTSGEARELIVDRSGKYLFAAFDDKLRVFHTGHGSVLPANEAPVADAGNDKAVELGSLVTLDGSSSYDPDGTAPLSYDWTIVQRPAGSAALLSDSGSSHPSFAVDVQGDYLLELVVTDSLDTASTPDNVLVTAYPQPTAGGSAAAMSVTKVVCINQSTGKRVKLYNLGQNATWDCEAAGLVVNPGDPVRMNVFGQAD